MYQIWSADFAGASKHSIFGSYSYIKSSLRTQPYTYLVNDRHSRYAISNCVDDESCFVEIILYANLMANFLFSKLINFGLASLTIMLWLAQKCFRPLTCFLYFLYERTIRDHRLKADVQQFYPQ